MLRTGIIEAEIAACLSLERLAKYLVAADGDLSRALELYARNARLAEAFYTPLQFMEICLRNRLNDQLSAAYGPDWFQWSRAPLHEDGRDHVARVMGALAAAGKPLAAGPLVAELGFGFWVGLLGPRYDATLWRNSLYRAFMYAGKRMSRRHVHGRFNMLRRFRNRIAHHEPIFLRDLRRTHEETIEAIGWLCPGMAAWTRQLSRWPDVAGE